MKTAEAAQDNLIDHGMVAFRILEPDDLAAHGSHPGPLPSGPRSSPPVEASVRMDETVSSAMTRAHAAMAARAAIFADAALQPVSFMIGFGIARLLQCQQLKRLVEGAARRHPGSRHERIAAFRVMPANRRHIEVLPADRVRLRPRRSTSRAEAPQGLDRTSWRLGRSETCARSLGTLRGSRRTACGIASEIYFGLSLDRTKTENDSGLPLTTGAVIGRSAAINRSAGASHQMQHHFGPSSAASKDWPQERHQA